MDASPFDNMPPIVQCSQVFVNLAITYYFGRMGLKIIPNVRLGDKCTYSSLDAYPRNTIISIGTNGFVRNKENFKVFVKQFKMIVKKLQPNFVLIYGTCPTILSNHLKNKMISFCVYESFIHKRRAKNNEGN